VLQGRPDREDKTGYGKETEEAFNNIEEKRGKLGGCRGKGASHTEALATRKP
jgi:hypothetical protein